MSWTIIDSICPKCGNHQRRSSGGEISCSFVNCPLHSEEGDTVSYCNKLKCPLYGKRPVLGSGYTGEDAIIFIGEAPTRSEEVLRSALVGEEGKMLSRIISDSGIPLEKCFFTHSVLCRPTNSEGQNREPQEMELIQCYEKVNQIIDEINPSCPRIVLVGAVAKKKYYRLFPGACSIIHPASLCKMDGGIMRQSLIMKCISNLKGWYK